MLRTFERTDCSCHNGISVRTGRRYCVCYECRVVAAAVFSVENEHKIQDPCFKLGELSVGSHEIEDVLGGIVLCNRIVDIEAVMLYIVPARHISVRDEHGESRDKLRALHSGEEVFFGDEPKTYTFSAPICVDSESGGAYVVFPFDIRKEFGKGRVKVHALFDGIPYDGSIVNMGVKDENGNVCYVIGVLKSIREKLGKSDGDMIEVRICER